MPGGRKPDRDLWLISVFSQASPVMWLLDFLDINNGLLAARCLQSAPSRSHRRSFLGLQRAETPRTYIIGAFYYRHSACSMTYESRGCRKLKGIDMSHCHNPISWDKLAFKITECLLQSGPIIVNLHSIALFYDPSRDITSGIFGAESETCTKSAVTLSCLLCGI